MRTELTTRLYTLLGERVRFSVSLARYTSFRIGGPADVFVEPETLEELRIVMTILHQGELPVFVLGGGTNILVSDRGVRGVVIKLGGGFNYAHWNEGVGAAQVKIGAARSLGRFVREAVVKGYGGIEFAEGIPGSVGGGLLMNAGAFGGELSRVVEAITGVSSDGTVVCRHREELRFTYRATALPRGFVIAEIEFCLWEEMRTNLVAAMENARQKRRRTQPHGYPNAGSIFKNPPGNYAGQLIEAAGLKGLGQGQVQVSEKHANFIVNRGGATAVEVRQLMERVQQTVSEKTRIWLEPEIRLVGEW
jgi:UDP-N-acetylmuramate dehydrogenase